jgi:cyanuric acid amidohydrolase
LSARPRATRVNDFTRGYATLALKLLLAESLKCAPSEIDKRVAIVMSGGTEGGLSPHLLVFCRDEVPATASAPRLAIGIGLTRDFKPEEIGRAAQIEETARAVAAATREAGITSAADVHFVQIKCPLLTKERIEEAARRGSTTATDDTYHRWRSRGARRWASPWRQARSSTRRNRRLPDWSLYSSVAAPRRGSNCCATRSSCWAMPQAGAAFGDHYGVMKDAIDARRRGACAQASAARPWPCSPRPRRHPRARSAAGGN